MTVTAWTDLVDALAAVLGSFVAGAGLVIAEPPAAGDDYWDVGPYFVQFAERDNHLRAEAVTDRALSAGKQLGSGGAERLTALGWHPPRVDDSLYVNWWFDLPWPARGADYRRLAELGVATLRDVFGVATPAELGYRAWIDGTAAEWDLPSLRLASIRG